METAGARGFDEVACEQQHCWRRTHLICSTSAKATKRKSHSARKFCCRSMSSRRCGVLSEGEGSRTLTWHSLGQTRTHVLVRREEDARRFRQSCAAQECAGQSCLTAPCLENCEFKAKVGLRSAQAMDRAQTAHLRSRRRRANTHRERPCASPTVRGGRHSRATCHFVFLAGRVRVRGMAWQSVLWSVWPAPNATPSSGATWRETRDKVHPRRTSQKQHSDAAVGPMALKA